MFELLSWWTVIIGILFFCLLVLKRHSERDHNLPPGPPRIPLLGNLTQIRGVGIDQLRHIAQQVNQYGRNGMATLQFGPYNRSIFVTNYDTVKKILNDDAFAGRPKSAVRDTFFHRQGLIFTDGRISKEHRRFALSTLRDFGMGKTWLQDLIVEEAKELVSDIKSLNGEPVNPTQVITGSVANVICAICYGQRFSHKDERFRRLARLVGQNVQMTSKTQMIEYFPVLRKVPFTTFKALFEQWTSNCHELVAFMKTLVDEHKANFRPGDDEPTDYIDAYLKQQHNERNNPDTTFTERQLLLSIVNLFGAGTETTSTTLTWGIVFLLENPEVYAKLQKEIDGVLGERLFPALEDKDLLPYSQAAILEIQRMGNLVPIPGRSPLYDVEVDGFKIPKGIAILPLVSAIHEDPQYFPEPLKFKPERFLDAKGQVLHKVEGFLPFGLGKRFCLGESLAKMELFLFFVTLVRNFQFKAPPGETISAEPSVLSIVNGPRPFNVSFLSRC